GIGLNESSGSDRNRCQESICIARGLAREKAHVDRLRCVNSDHFNKRINDMRIERKIKTGIGLSSARVEEHREYEKLMRVRSAQRQRVPLRIDSRIKGDATIAMRDEKVVAR